MTSRQSSLAITLSKISLFCVKSGLIDKLLINREILMGSLNNKFSNFEKIKEMVSKSQIGTPEDLENLLKFNLMTKNTSVKEIFDNLPLGFLKLLQSQTCKENMVMIVVYFVSELKNCSDFERDSNLLEEFRSEIKVPQDLLDHHRALHSLDELYVSHENLTPKEVATKMGDIVRNALE